MSHATAERFLQCPSCEQWTVPLEDLSKCPSCSTEWGAEEGADDYVTRIQGHDRYTIGKDGGQWPVRNCPSCGLDTLVGDATIGVGVVDGVPTSEVHSQWVCFSECADWAADEIQDCEGGCAGLAMADSDGFAICENCVDHAMRE